MCSGARNTEKKAYLCGGSEGTENSEGYELSENSDPSELSGCY